MINKKDFEKRDYIKIRISIIQKEKWKKVCSEKKISLTNLIINSVENRMMDNERKKVLEFIENQDNVFVKIETNINQVAKITNSQKFVSSKDLNYFSERLTEIIVLKEKQNRIFESIYTLLAK
ncbi:hypothetical protein OMO38_17240 [Chryseobacterium sp. 09-1422]|uniref:Mobilization protein n=1 Tax=Chryseobacterium kimseyorum TaxID=2984028 RepID=A0ABT3I2J5_9FLAO|nr:hypothetical protein [Chryseobacterium kimseyorum]MCW3170276.1 hypothetical protein [Chryseobacterium kimseyorum]